MYIDTMQHTHTISLNMKVTGMIAPRQVHPLCAQQSHELEAYEQSLEFHLLEQPAVQCDHVCPACMDRRHDPATEHRHSNILPQWQYVEAANCG